MSPTILARQLDMIVATLADLGDYLRDSTREPGTELDQRVLETFAGNARFDAVQARRSLHRHAGSHSLGELELDPSNRVG